jgi:hypothetical protein
MGSILSKTSQQMLIKSNSATIAQNRPVPPMRPGVNADARVQTGPPVPAVECWRTRRPGGTGGAGRRGRRALLRHAPQRLRLQDPAPLRAGPGSGGTTPRSGQPDNDIIFLREDDEDSANEISPTIQFTSPKDDEDDANEASPTIQFIIPKGDTNEVSDRATRRSSRPPCNRRTLGPAAQPAGWIWAFSDEA